MMYGNNYGYQPSYYPQMQPADTLTQLRNQQAQPQPSNGLIWVQGEGGAKSYLLAPNTTLLLMDSEDTVFYLKSSDASGIPLPLRKFRYEEVSTEIAPRATENNETEKGGKYVTHEELRAILAEMAQKKEADE